MFKKSKNALIASILSVAIIATLGVSIYSADKTSTDTTAENKNVTKQAESLTFDGKKHAYTDSIETYLMIGTDQTGEGNQADTLVLAVFNDTKNSFGFYPINRDTVAKFDADGGTLEAKIGESHEYGKTADEKDMNTVNAVSRLLGGLKIDGYYKLNMNDIDKVNDAIGGVTVTINDDLTALDPTLVKGETILLQGEHAENYIRARQNTDNISNVKRMERQEQYMKKAFSMISDQLKENPSYVNDLQDNLKDVIKSNADSNVLSNIANKVSTGTNEGIMNFDGELEYEGTNAEEFIIDNDSIIEQLSKTFDLAK